jgi:hypothetical protein
MKEFTGHLDVPFDHEPAKVLAISCCDGRFVDAVEQLVADLEIPQHDLIAFPGGPAHLHQFASSFLEHQAISDAAGLMVKLHHIELVLLIAHEDCGYYKHRFGESDPERQQDDLRSAAEFLRSQHPNLRVALYYLRPDPAGGVTVESVPLAGAGGSENRPW